MKSAHLLDLGRILDRGGVDRFLRETARFYASRLVLFDAEGQPLADWNREVVGEGATEPRIGEGPPDREHAVEVFGEHLGSVLAEPGRPEDERAAIGLAAHVARLLTELAMKEYELNDLSREILDSYEEVNLFYDISTALGSVRDVEGVCSVILQKACEIIKVRRASILLLDDKSGELVVAAARGIPSEETAGIRIPVGVGISGKVLESRTSQLVDDVSRLPIGMLNGYERYATRSFISVPLCVDVHLGGENASERGRAIGVMNMTDRSDRENFTSGDLKLLTALAGQAAVLIENIRLVGFEKELRIARTIQRSLLPLEPPTLPGIDLAGACVPARNIGGDYYDFLVRDEGRQLVLAIADVSGHNVASALMMAVVRSALRGEFRTSGDPGVVLDRLNHFLYDDLTRAELFLSLFCMVFDPVARKLRLANAGHNPALLLRPREGGCRLLDAEGILVGVMEEADYPEESVGLEPGDVVLLYTDGIVEAGDASGIMFGLDRLAGTLERCGHLPADGIIDRIFEEVYAFSGERSQADDMTAVALKMTGCGSDKDTESREIPRE